MAAIAASNVTYALVKKTVGESGYRKFVMTIAFGDGTLTYPAGGIPLLAPSLGCPNQILELDLFSPSSSDGFVYKYDAANNKVRIYQAPTVTPNPLVELGGGATPAATTLYLEVEGW